MEPSVVVGALLPRQSGEKSSADKFLDLMKDPFGAQLASSSIVAALGTSLGVTFAIFCLFCVLRPWNTIVYAPKLRHSDQKHAPPPIGKGLFAWWVPVTRAKEHDLVEKMGMDAAVFLRFTRMCRNLFLVLAIIGCAIIIPVNVINSKAHGGNGNAKSALYMMTPLLLFGPPFWAFVAVAYIFNMIICGFLWWNYRAVHRLRKNYMASEEYQNSLHSRTLMVTEVPRPLRSDQGIVEITDTLRTTPEVPRAAIGRNVRDIPELIEEHQLAVEMLETVLTKYLRNPNKIPAERPLCKPSKKDPEYTNKDQKVDAINYLTARIERLETKIRDARETVDKRDAMSYGFASYESIESAHSVAFAAKSKHPKGTTVQLAPKPNNIIWKNLPLDAKTRRWRRFINNLWVALLTAFWMIPNALIAVFLAQLKNLGFIWPAFEKELQKNPNWWAVVQGVLAPALTSAFYYFLPIIFRKLSEQAGDLTKTSRERHVIHQLYAFFTFNNLFVFSLFSAVWSFVAAVQKSTANDGKSFSQAVEEYHPFQQTMVALSNVSPFWITWLLQRNLGAAVDLAQVVNLAWGSFSRKFLNPTPRELIKRTAPPPFDYASYYNYFLFYSTVALCFATLQPLVLLVTAFYFSMDAVMKKYLLMYIFCTKNESGGLYWRVLFNRFLVGTFLSNLLIALEVGGRSGGFMRWQMLGAMIPPPLILLGFKIYCKRTFDDSIKYYTHGETKGPEAATPIDKEHRRRDRVAVRFGHPALYKKLAVPMVHEKSKHLLHELYKGRLDDMHNGTGYSDVYSMKRMSAERPGKAAGAAGPFEFVSENNMDFENYKTRSEFGDEHGGGEIFQSPSRPSTPGSIITPGSERGRSHSRDSSRSHSIDNGVTYPQGYHSTPSNLREYSPAPSLERLDSNRSTPYQIRDETALLHGAAPMGGANQSPYSAYNPNGGNDYFNSRKQ